MQSPHQFPRFGATQVAVGEVFHAVLAPRMYFGTCIYECNVCARSYSVQTSLIESCVWCILPDVRDLFEGGTVLPTNQLVLAMLTQRHRVRCASCFVPTETVSTLYSAPSIIVLDLESCQPVTISSGLALPVDQGVRTWKLVALVYRSGEGAESGHYIIRYIDPHQHVWFHDGMTTGAACIREAVSYDGLDLTCKNGAAVCHAIYSLEFA